LPVRLVALAASPRQLEKDGKAEKAEQADGSSNECPSPRQAL